MKIEDLYPTFEQLAKWGVDKSEVYAIERAVDNAVKQVLEEWGNIAKNAVTHAEFLKDTIEFVQALNKLTKV